MVIIGVSQALKAISSLTQNDRLLQLREMAARLLACWDEGFARAASHKDAFKKLLIDIYRST